MVGHIKHLLVVPMLVLVTGSGMAQRASSARDAFWSADDLISVTPNPAAHNRAKPRPRPTANLNDAAAAPGSPIGAGDQALQARATQVSQLVAENGYGAAPHVIRTSQTRLGLRCSLLLRGVDGEYSEVTPGTVFHSGDHIRLSFLANEPGYFYVIQQGSSGTWSPIYPHANSAADAAKIEAGKLQIVPSGTKSFQFDQTPGDEKLFVILSRTPIADIDRAIHNLRNGPKNTATQTESVGPELEAENVISDAFVKRLGTRDLVLVDEEKVDDTSASSPNAEKAIYVVNKASGVEDSSQVVLSLELRHE